VAAKGTRPGPPIEAVREWLITAGMPLPDRPTLEVSVEAREMACALIEEEAAEFRAAVEASDLVEVADAVADLLWVTIEAGLTFGVPIIPVFDEVHRSNLTKIETERRVVNNAGKIIAGPDFSPPNLRPILEDHGATADDLAAPTKANGTAQRPIKG